MKGTMRTATLVGLAACIFLVWVAPIPAQDEIKIGGIVSLTGSKAALGQEEKRGYEMALDKINSLGGVLKKKVNLILEDNRFDPSVSVSAAEKLINKDKVAAITGGYGSTETLATLAALKKYEPVVLWQGAGAEKIEALYGKEPWFFHLHPWGYYSILDLRNFFLTLDPKPQNIAIAYEDTSYGVDYSKFAKKFWSEAGFKIVAFEPFKSGSFDYTPLITKLKGIQPTPDIFYWVGYVGDGVLMMRQSREMNFNPKVFLDAAGVGFPEFKEQLGKNSEYVLGIDIWSPNVKFPASTKHPKLFPSSEDWVKEYKDRYSGREPNYWSIISYVAFAATCQAIEQAGTTEKSKVVEALKNLDTMTPMGRLKFEPGLYGSLHQGFRQGLVFQWQDGEKQIVFPVDVQTGKVKYPTPNWESRK